MGLTKEEEAKLTAWLQDPDDTRGVRECLGMELTEVEVDDLLESNRHLLAELQTLVKL